MAACVRDMSRRIWQAAVIDVARHMAGVIVHRIFGIERHGQ